MFGAISLQESAPLLGLFTKRFTSRIVAAVNRVSFQFHSYQVFCNYCYHITIAATRISTQASVSYDYLSLVSAFEDLGYI